MRTLQDIENELVNFECVCGRPRWDHDFGGGGNDETGCEGFTAVEAERFIEMVQDYNAKILETSESLAKD